MRSFLTVIGAALLVLSYVTISDARPHAKWLGPTQSGADYNRSDYDSSRDGDSSCFSRYTGLPDQYACSSHGG